MKPESSREYKLENIELGKTYLFEGKQGTVLYIGNVLCVWSTGIIEVHPFFLVNQLGEGEIYYETVQLGVKDFRVLEFTSLQKAQLMNRYPKHIESIDLNL